MNALRLYLRYLGQSLRSQLQYRMSFALLSVGQFVATGIEALGIWALFDRFGGLGQWTLPQVALFYGLVHMAFAFADALSRGFDVFGPQYVKTGNFDRVLLRPRSTVLQLAGHELSLRRVGRLAQAALVFTWAIYMLDGSLGVREWLVLGTALLGGIALFFGLVVCAATLSFWTVESLEIMNTLTYGGVETAQYPLAIYDRWLRRFFIFVVPLGCIAYFPVVYVLGVEDPVGSPRALQPWTPLAGFAFLGLSLLFFRSGVRRYTSTGS